MVRDTWKDAGMNVDLIIEKKRSVLTEFLFCAFVISAANSTASTLYLPAAPPDLLDAPCTVPCTVPRSCAGCSLHPRQSPATMQAKPLPPLSIPPTQASRWPLPVPNPLTPPGPRRLRRRRRPTSVRRWARRQRRSGAPTRCSWRRAQASHPTAIWRRGGGEVACFVDARFAAFMPTLSARGW
jgi:hypothetical protein